MSDLIGAVYFKQGVSLDGVLPITLRAIADAGECYRLVNVPCVVTSVVRTGPKELLHGKGRAFDLRLPSRYTKLRDDDFKVRDMLKQVLGLGWDVVLELGPQPASAPGSYTGEHIHVEYDPKEGDRT